VYQCFGVPFLLAYLPSWTVDLLRQNLARRLNLKGDEVKRWNFVLFSGSLSNSTRMAFGNGQEGETMGAVLERLEMDYVRTALPQQHVNPLQRTPVLALEHRDTNRRTVERSLKIHN